MDAHTVLKFWFDELSPKDWFVSSEHIDELVRQRFGRLHEQACKGELFQWRSTAEGRLAEVMVLDQFSRNLFRDNPQAFAADAMALALAQEAVALDQDHKLPSQQRAFLYMPYMHSESAVIHEVAESLFAQEGMEQNLDFELKHKVIIDRFGRYPHRNAVLGRESTPEELAFLKQEGSSF